MHKRSIGESIESFGILVFFGASEFFVDVVEFGDEIVTFLVYRFI